MFYQTVKSIGLFAIILSMRIIYAQDCKDPKSSEDVAYCLGKDLRESDVKINQIYQKLMNILAKPEKEKLRNEQRAWLKERDEVCMCESSEKNREKWYKEILKDYRKTVCVTRYTRQRTAELNRMLTDFSIKQKLNEPASEKSPTPEYLEKHNLTDYRYETKNNKKSGLWYLEIAVNEGRIAKFSPTALWIGCFDETTGQSFGDLSQIRSINYSSPIEHLGFALDLKMGKLYIRYNGIWKRGIPGSSGGMDLKSGRPYKFALETTVLINPLIANDYIKINLGEKPFEYSLPNGYRPFSETE